MPDFRGRGRLWRIAFCIVAAWCLAGCPVSHVDSTRQGATPDQPGADGEPLDRGRETDPQNPEPGGSAALSIAGASAGEGDGALVFVVSLSRAADGAVSVQYATADGTATDGEDYQSTRGTLHFPAGSAAPLRIAVTVTDDTVAEATETFTVRLSNAQGAALADAEATATGTIHDDDGDTETDIDTGTGDDYGDTQQAATLVEPATVTSAREPIGGHLETDGDVDYFRAVVDAGETVHAQIDPATQPKDLRQRAYVTIETGASPRGTPTATTRRRSAAPRRSTCGCGARPARRAATISRSGSPMRTSPLTPRSTSS